MKKSHQQNSNFSLETRKHDLESPVNKTLALSLPNTFQTNRRRVGAEFAKDGDPDINQQQPPGENIDH